MHHGLSFALLVAIPWCCDRHPCGLHRRGIARVPLNFCIAPSSRLVVYCGLSALALPQGLDLVASGFAQSALDHPSLLLLARAQNVLGGHRVNCMRSASRTYRLRDFGKDRSPSMRPLVAHAGRLAWETYQQPCRFCTVPRCRCSRIGRPPQMLEVRRSARKAGQGCA